MAGRIPQAFIDDLLARVDIVDVIDSRVKLKKTGQNYSACCPFHKEKTPSFTVSPGKQFYYCFGCGASGNALSFVMEFDHLDFPTAIDSLAGTLGMEVPREQHSSKHPDHGDLYKLMEKANQFYQAQLKSAKEAPGAIAYLKQRGLDGQTCKKFEIGFAPPGWNNLQDELTDSSEKEKKLITAGLLVEHEESQRRYDRFRDRIMFPIRDTRGRVIAFGGRVLGDAKPKYLNSPESPVFHKGRELYGLYEAKKYNRSLESLLVVEGYMDVVALSQLGIHNAVATLGTATTLDHMQRLFKTVPEVIFCFDGDDAGRRAAWRALESTLPGMEDGKQARFLFLPQGEDPDSMVRNEGAGAFLQRIQEQALALDSFLFRELEDGLDLHTMDGRARLTKLAQPYLSKLPEGIFKQLILKKMSDITGLDTNRLEAHYKKEPAAKEPKPTTTVYSERQGYEPTIEPDHYHDPHEDFGTSYPQQESHIHQEAPGGYDDFGASRSQAPYQQKTWKNKPYPQQADNTPVKVGRSIYAIRHLLCNPELATQVDDLVALEQDNDPDTELLLELLKTLVKQPKLATGALIAQWYGTRKGQRLQQVAALELGHQPNNGEFWEAIHRIKDNILDLQQKNTTSTLMQSLAHKKPGQMDACELSSLEQLLTLQRKRLKTGTKDSKK